MGAGLRRRFVLALLVIAAGALTLRVAYAVSGTFRPERDMYDWVYYRGEARSLAYGHGFVRASFGGMPGPGSPPDASHPPLLAILLAPISRISGDRSVNHDDLALRLFNCGLGTLAVVLIGLLGRDIAGDATGLAAAGIAAVYPNLWVNDGLIMPETLSIVISTAAVLVALRLLRRKDLRTAALLGALCGLGALARGELTLLIPFLLVPAVFAAARTARERARLLAMGVALVVVIVGPWVGYNFSRFQKPVLISTNLDSTLLNSTCPNVMSGRFIGSIGTCGAQYYDPHVDDSVNAAHYRKVAEHLIRQNLSRYPEVVLARIGRTWSLYRTHDAVVVATTSGRPRWVSEAGLAFYYPLLVAAIVGAVLLRRRRATLWPFLVLPFVVTFTMLFSVGLVRYRASAEPMIVVLAAVAFTSPELARAIGARRPAPATP